MLSLTEPRASAPIRGAILTHFFPLRSFHTLPVKREPQLESCSWSGNSGRGTDVIGVSQTIADYTFPLRIVCLQAQTAEASEIIVGGCFITLSLFKYMPMNKTALTFQATVLKNKHQ